MPTAATTTRGGTAQAPGRASSQPVVAMVPFIRASAEHREPTGIDVSKLMTGADQDLGVFDIPAYGYVRSLFILVQATAGAGAGAVAAEDGPFNAIKNIALTEPNRAPLSAFNTGFGAHHVL